MLAAFRWNLRMLSDIALLVGAFLIYNAVSVSVVRRRADIGTMRALGASRTAVMSAFLAEAARLATLVRWRRCRWAACSPPAPCGMLSTTVNALYVSSRPGPDLSADSVMLALVVGIGVAWLLPWRRRARRWCRPLKPWRAGGANRSARRAQARCTDRAGACAVRSRCCAGSRNRRKADDGVSGGAVFVAARRCLTPSWCTACTSIGALLRALSA